MLWNIRHPYQCLIPIDDRDISTIVQLPLAFVRSGSAGLFLGQFHAIGDGVYGWSRASLSDTRAYYLLMLTAAGYFPGLSVSSRASSFPVGTGSASGCPPCGRRGKHRPDNYVLALISRKHSGAAPRGSKSPFSYISYPMLLICGRNARRTARTGLGW